MLTDLIYVNTPELCYDRMEKVETTLQSMENWTKKKKVLNETSFSQEWIGVEPTNDGFADQSLTTWVRRHVTILISKILVYV